MTYRDDELKRDIDEIKSDISILKINVISIVQHLNLDINNVQALNVDINIQSPVIVEPFKIAQEEPYEIETSRLEDEEATIQDPLGSTQLAPGFSENFLVAEEVGLQKEGSTEFFLGEIDSKILIEETFILDLSLVKLGELRKEIHKQDKNLRFYKENKNIFGFCHCVIYIIAPLIKFFLRKKFEELLDDKNTDLIQGLYLVEKANREGQFPDNFFPKDLFLNKSSGLKKLQQDAEQADKLFFNGEKDRYLSLEAIERADLIFQIDLNFTILYKDEFYKRKQSPKSPIRQVDGKLSKSVERPIPKSQTKPQGLKIDYYWKLDAARQLRNIDEHEDNKEEAIEKRPYLKKYLDNYDGIAEAVQWFISQIFSGSN